MRLGSVSFVPKQRMPVNLGPVAKGKRCILLDKHVRKDICVADFTVISDKNKYMRKL